MDNLRNVHGSLSRWHPRGRGNRAPHRYSALSALRILARQVEDSDRFNFYQESGISQGLYADQSGGRRVLPEGFKFPF